MNSSKLGRRIVLYLISMIVILVVAFSILLYLNTTSTVNKSVGSQAINTATNLAALLDAEKYKRLSENPEESDLYWELREELNELRLKNGVMYAYTYAIPEQDDPITFLVDGMPIDNIEGVAPIGDISLVTHYKDVERVLEGEGHHTNLLEDDTYGQFLSSFVPLFDSKGEVVAIVGVDIAATQIQQIKNTILWTTLPISLVIILLISFISLFAVYWFIKSSTQPLTTLKEGTALFAVGDIIGAESILATIDNKHDNEISDFASAFLQSLFRLKDTFLNLNKSSKYMEDVVGSIGQAMHSVRALNDSMIESIMQIASGSKDQKVNNNEVVNAMEEMTIGIQRIADSSNTVAVSSNEMTSLVESSVHEARGVVSQIQQVETSVLATGAHVKDLGEKYKSIGNMVEVITNIADQTNLLALNAAIEAARAGESGKGFAVVAGEVRKLAELSRNSAEEIRSHLKQFEEVTLQALKEMETSSGQVRSGTQAVKIIGENLERVLETVLRVNDEIQDVSTVTEQMSASSEEVLASTEYMNGIMDDNVSRTNQVAEVSDEQVKFVDALEKTIEQLQGSTRNMTESINHFRVR